MGPITLHFLNATHPERNCVQLQSQCHLEDLAERFHGRDAREEFRQGKRSYICDFTHYLHKLVLGVLPSLSRVNSFMFAGTDHLLQIRVK